MTTLSRLSEPIAQHEHQPWAPNLVTLHAYVWEELAKGLRDRQCVNRFPTLVTVSRDGRPQARTVVLRAANSAEWQVEVYTESDSAKVEELTASPYAAIHIWNTAVACRCAWMQLQSSYKAKKHVRCGSLYRSLPN